MPHIPLRSWSILAASTVRVYFLARLKCCKLVHYITTIILLYTARSEKINCVIFSCVIKSFVLLERRVGSEPKRYFKNLQPKEKTKHEVCRRGRRIDEKEVVKNMAARLYQLYFKRTTSARLLPVQLPSSDHI